MLFCLCACLCCYQMLLSEIQFFQLSRLMQSVWHLEPMMSYFATALQTQPPRPAAAHPPTHTHPGRKLFRILRILCLSFPHKDCEGCMWAIRNWVLNRSTVFFLPSTTWRRWQIANWIYEQALLTLLHNYRNAMPLVFKEGAWRRIQIDTRLSTWMIEWNAMSLFLCDSYSFTLQSLTYFERCRWLNWTDRNIQMRCHLFHDVSLLLWFLIGIWELEFYGGCCYALVVWKNWLDS